MDALVAEPYDDVELELAARARRCVDAVMAADAGAVDGDDEMGQITAQALAHAATIRPPV